MSAVPQTGYYAPQAPQGYAQPAPQGGYAPQAPAPQGYAPQQAPQQQAPQGYAQPAPQGYAQPAQAAPAPQGIGPDFEYRNVCHFIGQIAPNQWMPQGFQWRPGAGNDQGSLSINLKLRKKTTYRNETRLSVAYIRIVAFGAAGQNIMNVLTPGAIVKVVGEYKRSNFQDPKTGAWKENTQFNLARDDGMGGPALQVLGVLPYVNEASTPRQNRQQYGQAPQQQAGYPQQAPPAGGYAPQAPAAQAPYSQPQGQVPQQYAQAPQQAPAQPYPQQAPPQAYPQQAPQQYAPTPGPAPAQQQYAPAPQAPQQGQYAPPQGQAPAPAPAPGATGQFAGSDIPF